MVRIPSIRMGDGLLCTGTAVGSEGLKPGVYFKRGASRRALLEIRRRRLVCAVLELLPRKAGVLRAGPRAPHEPARGQLRRPCAARCPSPARPTEGRNRRPLRRA